MNTTFTYRNAGAQKKANRYLYRNRNPVAEALHISVMTTGVFLLCLLWGPPVTVVAKDNPEVESSVCADCHDEAVTSMRHTAHADALADANELSCSSCHAGATTHVEDPSTENITNPANLDAGALTVVCSSCHMPHTNLDGLGFNAHVDGGVGCLDCHSIHNAPQTTKKLLVAPEKKLCLGCHADIGLEFDGH